ncbi:MAG: hypothetical protein EOP04_00930 [Proteobacteria bacterium]|nr:MAG: hypothetical protein EOP04_00930 [Pseudomonadota bacterium]
MKNIIAICLSILFAGELFAGAAGGGGTVGAARPGLTSQQFLKVYQGANNISREFLGGEDLFNLDLSNRIVTFDADRQVLDESAVMTFDEVVKYSLPALEVDADVFGR